MLRILKKEEWFPADGFPIAVECRDPQEPFGLHAHEFSEIVIITGGTGLHVTGEDSWQLATGDVFVIGGSRPHDYLNMERLRLINVLYDQNDLKLDWQDLMSLPGYHAMFHLEPSWRKRHQFTSHLRLAPRELKVTVELANQLNQEVKARSAGFRCMATTLFMQLVVHLSRCYSQLRHANSRALLRIAQTITYLETHFTEDVELDTLVEIAKMPRRSFIRAFENATGCTPIAYLIDLRMRRATELLSNTKATVTQIAFAVGFNDSNYFSRQFRQRYQLSPREYRDRH
jgi:AraC-like DNA-binding protein